MMNRMLFYFRYAARNLWRSRRWSAFAVLAVAAGVATVVALRSLGLAIGDSLTSNVRAANHGDITLSQGTPFINFGGGDDEDVFTAAQINRAQEWTAARGAMMSAYISTSNMQVTALDFSTAGRPQFASTLLIDPATYPPTQDIMALDPAGVPLGDLFQGGYEVVVSENLAQTQGIAVGDKVRVSGTEQEFIVRGIVPTVAEAGLHNIFAAFFGFTYINIALAGELPVPSGPNNISVILPDGTSNQEIRAAGDDLASVVDRSFNYFQVVTVPDRLEQNQQIADVMDSFIVLEGLFALLIGGVGIINTMLVMVRRRTDEIAALKTFGLKGRQVSMLFLAEAVLLGLFGSMVGSVLGVALSTVANAYGATLIQQPLTWRIHPEAITFGFALGLVITVVFGVLPVLVAAKVRPATILRPNEMAFPRAGIFHSLLAILAVVLVIGLIAGEILAPSFAVVNDHAPSLTQRMTFISNPYVVGIIGVAVVLLILGILVGVLWLIVWLVGKIPSFGSIDLRMAQRNLSTRRIRTATTLLALSAGMFALSGIAFFGEGAREILQYTLTEAFGGNVIVFSPIPPAISQPLINLKVSQLQGVTYQTRLTNLSGRIRAVDGQELTSGDDNRRFNIQQEIRDAVARGDTEQAEALREEQQQLWNSYVTMVMRDTNNPNMKTGNLLAGRDLTLEDRGQPVTVMRYTALLQAMGAGVGSTVTVEVDNRRYDLVIVGLIPDVDFSNFQTSISFGAMTIPPETIPSGSMFQFTILQIEDAALNNALLELSSLPFVYALDVSFFDGVLRRMLDQMSAIPILVGLLSLGAAAVIMANTVALATLERRRQIGVLKAIGLKGRRVMRIMVLENVIVSLLGGILGLGLSALGVVIMTHFGLEIAILVPTDALPVAIALVAAAVAIGWLATYLSARFAVRERVLNVLRYD